jgi:hypothetical protein
VGTVATSVFGTEGRYLLGCKCALSSGHERATGRAALALGVLGRDVVDGLGLVNEENLPA